MLDCAVEYFGSIPAVIINGAETDDEIGTVLRMHLLVESVLRFYVTSHPAELSVKDNDGFAKVANVAKSIGMPQEIIDAALQLNKVRNRIAHNIGATLEVGEISELARRFDGIAVAVEDWVPIRRRYIDVINLKKGKVTFGAEGLRLDFLLICTHLYSELLSWTIKPAKDALMALMD